MTTTRRSTTRAPSALEEQIGTLTAMLSEDYVPRREQEARWAAQTQVMNDLTRNVEKLTQSVMTLQERMPEAFVPRREFETAYVDSKSDRGALNTQLLAMRQQLQDFERETEERWSRLNDRIGGARIEAIRDTTGQRIQLDSRLLGWIVAGITALGATFLAGGHLLVR